MKPTSLRRKPQQNARSQKASELVAPTTDGEFTATAATSTPVRRRDWTTGRLVNEVLVITPEAVDMTALASGRAPILDSHRSGSTEAVVGVVTSARIQGGKLIITGRLSARDDVAPIAQDVADGILANVSVGYRVSETQRTEGPNGQTDVVQVTRWTPLEVSLVPVGADTNAHIRNVADLGTRGELAVADPELATRERIDAIRLDAVPFNAADLAETAIRNGTSHGDFELAILGRMAAIDEQLITPTGNPDELHGDSPLSRLYRSTRDELRVIRDEGDTRRGGMQAAIVARLAESTAPPGQRVDIPEIARAHPPPGARVRRQHHRQRLVPVRGSRRRAVFPLRLFGGLPGGRPLSTMDAWDVQGIKVKLEHDFGVAATDFRGGYRNAGA